MHSIENRFVIGPSDVLFGGVGVCTFQPGNFTGQGSDGVKKIKEIFILKDDLMDSEFKKIKKNLHT